MSNCISAFRKDKHLNSFHCPAWGLFRSKCQFDSFIRFSSHILSSSCRCYFFSLALAFSFYPSLLTFTTSEMFPDERDPFQHILRSRTRPSICLILLAMLLLLLLLSVLLVYLCCFYCYCFYWWWYWVESTNTTTASYFRFAFWISTAVIANGPQGIQTDLVSLKEQNE